jgi:hypothetical protein
LLDVINETMQPNTIGIWLVPDAGSRPTLS